MLGIHDIPLWNAKNKIKSDWGLRCVRIHEIMNFTYIKLSTIYKYIHLKWEQCSLTIIECIYMSRRVDQNTTVPIVMHSLVWNDCLQKMLLSCRILSLPPSPELRIKHSFSWPLHCLPHSEEFVTLLMTAWRKCYKGQKWFQQRGIFCLIQCHYLPIKMWLLAGTAMLSHFMVRYMISHLRLVFVHYWSDLSKFSVPSFERFYYLVTHYSGPCCEA